jgi:hypothetical protein
MRRESLEAANGRRRVVVVLLVLAVLSVPALVRATDSFKNSSTPLLRLNRGFKGPETKSRLAPPAAQPLEAPLADPPPPASNRCAPIIDESLPDPLFDSSDTLRGPPAGFATTTHA